MAEKEDEKYEVLEKIGKSAPLSCVLSVSWSAVGSGSSRAEQSATIATNLV